MVVFKKKPLLEWDEATKSLLRTATDRVHKLNDEQLLQWADTAASAMMFSFEDFMKHDDPKSLDELTEAVVSLQAVVRILRERYNLTYQR